MFDMPVHTLLLTGVIDRRDWPLLKMNIIFCIHRTTTDGNIAVSGKIPLNTVINLVTDLVTEQEAVF